MQLQEHYQRLARYDAWANRETIQSLRAVQAPPQRSLKWLAHVLAAQEIWLARLRTQPQPMPVWPEFSLNQCEEQAQKLSKDWNEYLAAASAESLEREISYKNSAGDAWLSTVQDILTHVFMHSAYHRGQIASDMRQAGHVPAYTDFIHSARQRLLE